MKKLALNVAAIMLIVSCSPNTKTYQYVEIVTDSLIGGSKVVKKIPSDEYIIATTDSIAYIKAFIRFCISEKIDKEYQEAKIENYTTAITFFLLDEEKNDISQSISFVNKEQIEDSLKKLIFDRPNNFLKSNDTNPK